MHTKEFNIKDLNLLSISLIDGAIENPDNIGIEEIEPGVLNFHLGFEKLINPNDEKILIRFQTIIDCAIVKGKAKQNLIKGNFTIQYIFHFKGLQNFIEETEKEEKKLFVVNQELDANIVSIVYSTSRGIIYNRCLGTVLGNVILPVLEMNTLLEIADGPRVDKLEPTQKKPKQKRKIEK
jgi:hypothetical protein